MRIAKLILHFNTLELTANLCRMVPDAIVIDNGSSVPFLPENPMITVMRFEDNLGFTRNWNRALRLLVEKSHDTWEAFWLMNSDIVIDKDSIDRIERVMTWNDIPMITPSYNCWMDSCTNKATGTFRPVKCIEFTAPVIRRDVFEKIGFFDGTFSRGYGVEFDWSLRMKKAGIKQYCDDLSSFRHIGQQTIKSHGTLQDYEKVAVEELRSGMSRKYGPRWKPMIMKELDVFKPKKAMKIAVYTTIFGDYAPLLSPVSQSIPADFICISDNESIFYDSPWKIEKVNFPRADFHPRMRAKFFKLFPWECKKLGEYEVVIFIDASIQVISTEFVRHCIDTIGHHEMLLYKHPVRDCIYAEAKASYPLVKYNGEPIQEQIESYKAIYPEHGGLFACGVMVRKMRSPKMREVMAHWWWEQIKWSYQDQISFPVVCKLARFIPATFEESQVKNEIFKIHWHDDLDQKQSAKPVKLKASK